MILQLWETIIGYFKEKTYWTRIQPLFTLLTLYIMTTVLVYQFVEWLEPVEDNVNGFQLEREGTLSVSWSVKF